MNNQPRSVVQILLPYAGIMAVLAVFANLVVAFRGSTIDAVSGSALLPAFVYYVYFQITARAELSRIRFGLLVAHLVAFLIVNLSYHIHAATLAVLSFDSNSEPSVSLSPGWFGVLFGMFCIWGLGLLIHTVASIASRGFEEISI